MFLALLFIIVVYTFVYINMLTFFVILKNNIAIRHTYRKTLLICLTRIF